jgi:hypothetical protein
MDPRQKAWLDESPDAQLWNAKAIRMHQKDQRRRGQNEERQEDEHEPDSDDDALMADHDHDVDPNEVRMHREQQRREQNEERQEEEHEPDSDDDALMADHDHDVDPQVALEMFATQGTFGEGEEYEDYADEIFEEAQGNGGSDHRQRKSRKRRGKSKRRTKLTASASADVRIGPGAQSLFPCLGCHCYFNGRGYALPRQASVQSRLRKVFLEMEGMLQQHSKAQLFKGHGESIDSAQPVRTSRRGDCSHNEFISELPLFCSWKCVREWNQSQTSVQFRYYNDLLIGVAEREELDRKEWTAA